MLLRAVLGADYVWGATWAPSNGCVVLSMGTSNYGIFVVFNKRVLLPFSPHFPHKTVTVSAKSKSLQFFLSKTQSLSQVYYTGMVWYRTWYLWVRRVVLYVKVLSLRVCYMLRYYLNLHFITRR